MRFDISTGTFVSDGCDVFHDGERIGSTTGPDAVKNAALLDNGDCLLDACRKALRILVSQRKYLNDDRQALGHNGDAMEVLSRAIAKVAGPVMLLAATLSGCATTETRYAVEYRADATRPAEGVIVAGVSGGFSSVLR